MLEVEPGRPWGSWESHGALFSGRCLMLYCGIRAAGLVGLMSVTTALWLNVTQQQYCSMWVCKRSCREDLNCDPAWLWSIVILCDSCVRCSAERDRMTGSSLYPGARCVLKQTCIWLWFFHVDGLECRAGSERAVHSLCLSALKL